ncbi:unnamed protein product, partial [marine sediment metagenome]
PQEGQLFANFLQEHRGKYDGVILCQKDQSDFQMFLHLFPPCDKVLLWSILLRGVATFLFSKGEAQE